MKKKILLVLLLVLLTATAAYGLVYGADNYKKNLRYVITNGVNDPIRRFMVDVEASLGGGQIGDATIWYVNSNVTSEGGGTSWSSATDTLDEAIDLASAGDWIYVAEAHAETISGADGWDADLAGITIYHFGNGTRQGTYTFSATGSTVAIGAANVTIYGGRFVAGISAVAVGISIEAAGDDFALIGADFPEPSSSGYEFVRAILLATGADRVKIIGCDYSNIGEIGGTNFIDLDTGIVDEIQIIGNRIKGEFSEGAIHSDKACTSMWIEGNTITNYTTGQHGIEITANATGVLKDNFVSTDTIAASYDVGYLEELGINWWDDEGTRDTSPVPWTTNETGVNRWGATELAQIEAEVEDALAVEILEKFLANADGGSNAYPDSVVSQSILAFLMCIGANPAITTFDNTTDSLEAIANHVQTLITTGAGTDVYPSGVTNESIIAFMLAKGSTATASTYDNTTDSLEALSEAISAASTTLIPGRTYAIVKAAVDLQSANLFDVAGGPILITSFTGLITETVAGAAETTKIIFDGVDDFEFSTAVNLTTKVKGTRIIFSAANPAALTPIELGAVGSGNLMEPWFCPIGMIEQVDGEANAQNGIVSWYMTFVPLTSGVTVTVQ